jgi:hypothetical protein
MSLYRSPDINIVPGLSGLNLNILHAVNMHMIDNAKHTIFKWIQKEHVFALTSVRSIRIA